MDGVPLLVDTGTSTYAPGPVRDYERSTAAHNTVEVDGADSTEVWGAFRAARRARVGEVVARADGGVLTVEAAHDGFRRLPGRPVHRRRWSLSGDRAAGRRPGQRDGRACGDGALAPGARVGLRLAGGAAAVHTPAGEFRVGGHRVAPGQRWPPSHAPVATGFGRTVDAPVLICRIQAELPVRISTAWRRAGDPQLMSAGEPAFAFGRTT